MNKQSKLIVISAPSGGGKTTLCSRLLRDFPELVLSISATTRKARGQEQDGKDYFFLDQDAFQKQIAEGKFAEWAVVHGHYYGTPKQTLDQALASRVSVLLDIDVQGAESLKRIYQADCITFFIVPPDLSALEARLRSRGTDSDETIRKRLNNAENEMLEAPRFDHVIVNDDLERAYAELKSLIKSYINNNFRR